MEFESLNNEMRWIYRKLNFEWGLWVLTLTLWDDLTSWPIFQNSKDIVIAHEKYQISLNFVKSATGFIIFVYEASKSKKKKENLPQLISKRFQTQIISNFEHFWYWEMKKAKIIPPLDKPLDQTTQKSSYKIWNPLLTTQKCSKNDIPFFYTITLTCRRNDYWMTDQHVYHLDRDTWFLR